MGPKRPYSNYEGPYGPYVILGQADSGPAVLRGERSHEIPAADAKLQTLKTMWVVVKIMVPFLGTLNIRCRIIIGTPKRGHNFDNHPCGCRL